MNCFRSELENLKLPIRTKSALSLSCLFELEYLLGAEALHRRVGDAVEVALVDVIVELSADGEQAAVDRFATLAGRAREQAVAPRYEPVRGLVHARDREARLSLLVAVRVALHRALAGRR